MPHALLPRRWLRDTIGHQRANSHAARTASVGTGHLPCRRRARPVSYSNIDHRRSQHPSRPASPWGAGRLVVRGSGGLGLGRHFQVTTARRAAGRLLARRGSPAPERSQRPPKHSGNVTGRQNASGLVQKKNRSRYLSYAISLSKFCDTLRRDEAQLPRVA
jgi:hypothetical protein